MTTHSSILAWEIPWREEPGGLQSMGLQELDTTSQLNNNILTYSSFFLLLAISLVKYFLNTTYLYGRKYLERLLTQERDSDCPLIGERQISSLGQDRQTSEL